MNTQVAGWSPELTRLHEEVTAGQHPMDVASRRDAIEQLKRRFRTSDRFTVLEVGCGSGYLLREICSTFPVANVIAADPHATSPWWVQTWSILDCPLDDASCEAVVALNVLEHIQDDVAALRQLYRVLKPGGIAIIEVPAGQHLYDAYDAALGHYRRYFDGVLASRMRGVGFAIERETHLGFFAYPAFWACKTLNQLTNIKPTSDVVRRDATGASGGWLMRVALKAEQWLGRYVDYPVGIRCLVVGRK